MKRNDHIRTATTEDLRGIVFLLSSENLPVEGVDYFLENGYCVAEYEGRLVGVAGMEIHASFGLLRSVAVAHEWRGKGIGRDLVLDRLARAEISSLSMVYLLTIDAAGYFERFGFTSINRNSVPDAIRQSTEFSSLCPVTATVMRKRIVTCTDAVQ